MMMYDVSIDAEQADNLVAAVLMETFDDLSRNILSAQGRGISPGLKTFEVEDMVNDIKVREAIKEVLAYYLTHDDYVDFMEMQRVYGNV